MAVGTVFSGHTGMVTLAGVAQLLNIHEWTLNIRSDIFEYQVFHDTAPSSAYSSIAGMYDANGTFACWLDSATATAVTELAADKAPATATLKLLERATTDKTISVSCIIVNRRVRAAKQEGINEILFDFEVDGVITEVVGSGA